MAWTKLKSAVAVGVCAIIAGTTLVIESQKVSRLRAENQRLAEQLDALQKSRADEAARARSGNDEIERLRRDAAEVHKLRGEVALLRKGKEDATKLRAQLDALQAKLKPASQAKGNEEPQPSADQEQEKQIGIAKMNYLRSWTLAFVLYAQAHEGRAPKDFSEAERFLPANFNSPFESGAFEIVYEGLLTPAKNTTVFDASRLILMREREPTQSSNGRWVRAYAFADGHSEMHSAPTPDGFADWEKERMVRAVPGQ